MLNGCEVHSNRYAECVGIRGDEVIAGGMVIDHLNTDKKVKILWDEYVEQEGV